MSAHQKMLDDLQKKEEKAKKEKKVVHIFPHSHTDEGWLSTSNDFFTGDDDMSIYVGSVKDILDTTMQQLFEDKNRTFTFAEIKYFKMWYDR